MIANGVIQAKEIFGVPFIVDLVPENNKSSRPGLVMLPTSITIHETDNVAESADARRHTVYIDNTRNYVGWHFTVDDGIIIQELPINENAWQAGDGPNGRGNRTSIAIEICVNAGGDFEKAKENAAKLAAFLKFYIKTIGPVYQHHHWTGKNCPRRLRKNGWSLFIEKINEFKIEKKEKQFDVPDWALEAWKWAYKNGLNDGIVQNKTEIQTVAMLYNYHQTFGPKND